uniref:Ig-like domain-containing protein n=1 Tax=Oncorhynchus kisutch TaxID=8019 RepID=A0A8C7IQN5_ONCKI
MENTLLCVLLFQPRATLRISPQGLLYSVDTVTLQCDIPDYTDWTYYWYINNQPGYSTHGKTITISLPDQAGQYQCLGTRTDRPQKSQLSKALSIQLTALPTASVSISPQGLLYSGETVSMQCDISMYTDWTYSWYIGNNLDSSTPGKTITTLSNRAGQYRCVGVRTSRPQWSQFSVFLPIRVTDYQPSTTLTSDKEDVFTGDRVTLSCTVESPGWKFYWYRHRLDFTPVTTTSGYSYTLSWVSVSDGGQYWCRAGRGDPVYYTQYSDPVQIHVTGKPKAVLRISPQWLNPGDSVALNCKVDKTSTGWRFSWYRTVPYRAGIPSLSDKSYSLQPLSDNGTSEDSYTLIPAGPTPTGGYVCRGGRGDPVYYTHYSEPQFLWSGDLQPSVFLRISPNTTQHFTSMSL